MLLVRGGRLSRHPGLNTPFGTHGRLLRGWMMMPNRDRQTMTVAGDSGSLYQAVKPKVEAANMLGCMLLLP